MTWALLKKWDDADKDALTFGEGVNLTEAFIETDDGLLVPRSYRVSDTDFSTTLGSDIGSFEPINLREAQAPAVDAVMDHLTTNMSGGILFAPCGTGKTVMGLEVLRRLGRRTLVLVHKSFLLDQWVERASMFLPNAKVQIWQRDTLPDDDADIVIGMVQSITNVRREYPQELFDSFGTLITDETHRYSAPLWQGAIVKFSARYRLGLTATPSRKDGLHHVFMAHIGAIIYELHVERKPAKIWRVDTDVDFEPHSYRLYNGDVNTAKLITMISQVDHRTEMISAFAVRAVKSGRKVLILSERVAHTKELQNQIQNLLPEDMTASLYIGGMKQEKLDKSSEADVIIGTYAMAQEGLDIPALDTLILATPKTSITQSVGRILRDSGEGKKDPVVVDIVDSRIEILNAYWYSRRKKYLNLGYKFVRTR